MGVLAVRGYAPVWARLVLGWSVVVTLIAACASPEPVQQAAPVIDPRTAVFCAQWPSVMASNGDERLLELLEVPPPGLEGAAAQFADAERSTDPAEGQDAARRLRAWVSVNCTPGAALPGASAAERRVAPAVPETPRSVVFCFAGAGRAAGPSPFRMVIYGDASQSDPYSAPMVGLLWGERDGDQRGDGDATPVRVRGTDGVAAPITVFQQTIPDGLGTVITWREGTVSVGLYGRFWDRSRTDELVALADSLDFVDGEFRLPQEARPKNYEQLFAGSPHSLELIFATNTTYTVHYKTIDAASVLTISGYVLSAEEFEAVRFFAAGLRRSTTAGREALAGDAWQRSGGPAMVTWREADGLVVRLVGFGVDLATVHEMAEKSEELSRAEWVELVESDDECPVPVPPSFPRSVAGPVPSTNR